MCACPLNAFVPEFRFVEELFCVVMDVVAMVVAGKELRHPLGFFFMSLVSLVSVTSNKKRENSTVLCGIVIGRLYWIVIQWMTNHPCSR